MSRVKFNGVDIEGLVSIMGLSSGDDICHSPNINAYSMVKPIEFGKATSLTDTDFQQANWGYTIPPAKLPKEIMGYVKSGTIPSGWEVSVGDRVIDGGWKYTPPSTYARITDFDGYDHGIDGIWQMTINGSTGNPELMDSASTLRFILYSQQNVAIDEFAELRRGASTPMYFGVLCFDDDTNRYEYFNCEGDTLEISNSEFDSFLGAGSSSGSVKHIIPCVTSQLLGKDGWVLRKPSLIPLAMSYRTITYIQSSRKFHTYSQTAYVSGTKSVTCSVTIMNSGNATGSCSVRVQDESGAVYFDSSKSIASGGTATWEGSVSYTGTLPTMLYKTVSYDGNQSTSTITVNPTPEK